MGGMDDAVRVVVVTVLWLVDMVIAILALVSFMVGFSWWFETRNTRDIMLTRVVGFEAVV